MNRLIPSLLAIPLLLVATTLWANQPVTSSTNGNGTNLPIAPAIPPSTATTPGTAAPPAPAPNVPGPIIAPVPAKPIPALPIPNPWGLSINNFLSDDEMDMLFDYLRDAFIATITNGEDASMPPELAFKLAILRQRVIREGDAAVQQLMQALQKEVDRALREYQQKQPPQPPSPADPNRS